MYIDVFERNKPKAISLLEYHLGSSLLTSKEKAELQFHRAFLTEEELEFISGLQVKRNLLC